jgi:hypothetical protein
MEESITKEIEKDIERLQTITERFSKIGSEPVLERSDIVAETEASYTYLQSLVFRSKLNLLLKVRYL